MIGFGAIAFNAPFVLLALIVLPVVYWLLRILPPPPRQVAFPAIRFLLGLSAREETPAHSPLWLVILRLLIAALVIVALAQPVLNPDLQPRGDDRPLVVVLDDDWSAAHGWTARVDALRQQIDRAARGNRLVVLARTTPTPFDEAPPVLGPLPARQIIETLDGLEPNPWPTDRARAATALDDVLPGGQADVVWVTNGLADSAGDTAFVDALSSLGPVTALIPDDGARLLRLDQSDGGALQALVRGLSPLGEATVMARANDGRLLARVPVTSTDDDPTAGQAVIDLPPDAMAQIDRVVLSGPPTAGGVALVDRRWQRHGVGVVSVGDAGLYPLLSPLHYLARAVRPFSDPVRSAPEDLVDGPGIDMIVATDEGLPGLEAERALIDWIEAGGVYVQFAGPRLAEAANALVPVRLRTGGRSLSGSMSWTQPMPLAPFPTGSPFAGLSIPADVQVSRQVLAEPGPHLAERTWAALEDGTP